MKEEKSNHTETFLRQIGKPFNTEVRQFLESCRIKNQSPHTIETYGQGLSCFFRWLLGANGAKRLTDISREVLADYQRHLYSAKTKTGKPFSGQTQASRLTALSAFFLWLTEEQKILINPASALRRARKSKTLPRNCLTHHEAKKLLAAPDITTYLGLRNRSILEVLYASGVRNSELRNLELSDFKAAEGFVTVRAGKGGEDRVAPLGKAAIHFTSLYMEKSRKYLAGPSCKYLFVTQQGEKLHRDTLNRLINEAAKRAGIKRQSKITAHALRHSCATAMLKGRADIRYIQELLGHKLLSSTQIYTKVEIGDLKRVHSRCHPREKEAIDKSGQSNE